MINESSLPFISEVFDQLQPEKISIKTAATETTIDNVIDKILQHEKQGNLYSTQLKNEIDFLSSHFYELREEQTKLFERIEYGTIERINDNSEWEIIDEQQNYSYFNGPYDYHTFPISKNKQHKFIFY